MIKIMNVTTKSEVTVNTVKAAAEFIRDLKITDNSFKTIRTNIGKALKNEEEMYGMTFAKFEENQEVVENNEVVEAVASESAEVEVVENVETIENSEIIENDPIPSDFAEVEEISEVVESEEIENADQSVEASEELIEEVEVIEEVQGEVVEESPEDKLEVVEENEEPKANKRARGIGVQFYENDVLMDTFVSIQAVARFMKEYTGRSTMPYTPIHKSIREGIDWVHSDGKVFRFQFENDTDRKTEYKTRVAKGSQRGNGKSVAWFVNEELKGIFPSIKAAVEKMKEVKQLGHMPYTAVQRSIREDIDWEENSFKYYTEDMGDVKEEEAVEQNEAAEEVTEEIVETVEVPTEEAIEELQD